MLEHNQSRFHTSSDDPINALDLSSLSGSLTVEEECRSARPAQRHHLLSLPIELRLYIYSLLADGKLGLDKVHQDGGRSRMRILWASAPYEFAGRSTAARHITRLMDTCTQLRGEILSDFLKGYILKLPAWNDDFKLQCLYWINDASDCFIRNLTWIWLEGVYWRFSIHLTRPGLVGAAMLGNGEDKKATKEDCHQYDETEIMPGKGFVLRIDFVRQMRGLAIEAGRDTFATLENFTGEKGADQVGLSRDELRRVVQGAALCAGEQLRAIGPENFGVRTVLPAP